MDAQTVVLQTASMNVDNYTNYLLTCLHAAVEDNDMKKILMMMMVVVR